METVSPQLHPETALPAPAGRAGTREAPFLHAPECARAIFLVTLAAACAPLLAGLVLFGWRAGVVAVLSVAGCALTEQIYFRVARAPALLGRSHAFLTGVLLSLTLPAHVPWYVPLVAAAFAVIVGKGIFGGVGHFLWQPALVGRLAVAVIFPALLAGPSSNVPGAEPILARTKLLTGDVLSSRHVENYRGWRGCPAPAGADAMLIKGPSEILRGLTLAPEPQFSALAYVPQDAPRAKPALIVELPPINDLLYGARPGGLGETCVVVIIVAGLYLVYRNYVKLELPLMFVAAAACVAALGPIELAGPNDTVRTVWRPVLAEGLDVGLLYVCYQLFSGGIFLAAFFLATEMTSRPVTTGGQVIFAIAAGTIAMLLELYVGTPIPAYMAVLAMNTFTPTIDAIWRPRVLGQKRFAFLRGGRRVYAPARWS